MALKSKPLGVYLHIPFCRRRCQYCDFLSQGGASAVPDTYVRALRREWKLWRSELDPGSWTIQSIYFGGGTPSLLAPDQVAALISAIGDSLPLARDCEVTLEGNPDSLSLSTMQGYRTAGVNRLSIGVQSFDDTSLRALGRLHDAARAVQALEEARAAGIENLSLDLMYGLPGSSTLLELRSLQRAVALGPEHISWYNLTLASGTPLGSAVEKGSVVMPNDDTVLATMRAGWSFLASKGYGHYEISNFGRPGFASRHNLAYWLFTDYIGLGRGASGFLDGTRWTNLCSAEQYDRFVATGRRPVATREHLTGRRREGEYIMLRMRLPEIGLQSAAFRDFFGKDVHMVFGRELAWLEQNGLITALPDRIVCTQRGLELNNVVAGMFLGDDVVQPQES